MYNLKIVDAKQFSRVVAMSDVVDSVSEAFSLYSSGKAGLFPIIIHEFESGVNDMDIKSGHLEGSGIYGLKILGYNKDNPDYGMPALSGLIVIMSTETQQPLGIVDASLVTFMRTGAAGALAAKTLSRPDSKKVVIVGSGSQGRAQLMGLAETMPQIEEVVFVDLNLESAKKLVAEDQGKYETIRLEARSVEDLEDVLKTADILVTCTTSRKAFIDSAWIRPGTHINAIGADMPGKHELDENLFSVGKVFVDSIDQAVKKGETQWAYGEEIVTREAITEIGEVINEDKRGRESRDDITIFDATGMALQDLITAKLALTKAEKLNRFTSVIMES